MNLKSKKYVDNKENNFLQIKYTESGQDYTLYIQSKGEAEREEWIILLRNLIRHNPALCDNFHPELWSSKWLCCGEPNKNVLGCQPISWIPRPTKSDPAPPLPLSDPLLSPDSPGPPERLIVVAVYPFTAIEPGDLSLIKGEQYIVLDDSQVHSSLLNTQYTSQYTVHFSIHSSLLNTQFTSQYTVHFQTV